MLPFGEVVEGGEALEEKKLKNKGVALDYFGKLKSSCVDAGASYKEHEEKEEVIEVTVKADATLAHFDKLKLSCGYAGVSYEDEEAIEVKVLEKKDMEVDESGGHAQVVDMPAAAGKLVEQIAMLHALLRELSEKSQCEIKKGMGALVKQFEALHEASSLVSLRRPDARCKQRLAKEAFG